jgi:hypothetical protein
LATGAGFGQSGAMPISEAPKLSKWPFLMGDLLLVGLGALVLQTSRWPLEPLALGLVAACFALGAWLAILPFLREHAAAVKLWEQTNLAEAAQQIDRLATLANHIAAATGQWQAVQEVSGKTVASATELATKMNQEARVFAEFIQRTHDQEKQTLRLEVEKLRRNEGDFLQVLVHLLDHIYALFCAAARTGQQPIIAQLSQFRAACLDTVRRLGVGTHEARAGDEFDTRLHQTPDGKDPAPGAKIVGTIACGYSYQGQPVRRILVALQKDEVAPAPTPNEPAAAPADAEDPELPLAPEPTA